MSSPYFPVPGITARISQLSASFGIGDIGLTGAVGGFKALNDYYSVGEEFYYTIFWGEQWETGIGELVSSFILRRKVVLQSSNGGERVHFGNTGFTDKTIQIHPLPHAFHEPERNIFHSHLNPSTPTTMLLINDTGYFVYVGRSQGGLFNTNFVEFQVSVAGAGAQVADVGIFTSPLAPNKTAQTLTKQLTASSITGLTSTGMKRNTAGFNSAFTAQLHFWVGLRTAMATTQPTCLALRGDASQGHVLVKPTCGAFSALGATFSTSLPAIGTGNLAPDLRLTGM